MGSRQAQASHPLCGSGSRKAVAQGVIGVLQTVREQGTCREMADAVTGRSAPRLGPRTLVMAPNLADEPFIQLYRAGLAP